MAVSASQEAAFTDATLGISMSSFSLTILLVFYSVLYLWAVWIVFSQWKSWSNRKIDFYTFLMRVVRSIFLILVLGFLLR